MRHIRSFMLSLVLAPAIWALTGLGLIVQDGRGPEIAADQARQVGLAALAAAGLLVAVLALGRLSPLGPSLAGLGFLMAVAYAPSLRLMVPELPNGLDEALIIPADGYAAVLGIPLLGTALSGRRWRTPQQLLAYPAPAPMLVSPPAPTLFSPPPTLVSPPPTLVSPPPTLVSPAGSMYASPTGSTYISPAAPAYAAPHDPSQDGAYRTNGSAAPGSGGASGSGPNSPWARPGEPFVDDATDDLSIALRPLRTATPPPAR